MPGSELSVVASATSGDAIDPSIDVVASALAGAGTDIPRHRSALEAADRTLADRFRKGESVASLVRVRARVIDALMLSLWQQFGLSDDEHLTLVAVGGYGRGELHPYSDVDITVLLDDGSSDSGNHALSQFVTALWDLGLDIGHSVRSIEQCRTEAAADISVATALMESRTIAGSVDLFKRMQAAVSPERIWPSADFFAAKRKEQVERHRRYDDTAYKLEPNVKGSPGGLRDIQMIGWVAKRQFGVSTFGELVAHNFLTQGQLQRLNAGQEFLWRVRFGLHILTGRREDRLLFDHQTNLAHLLGYEDASYTLAVEQLMQRYYRTVMDLSRLNEMLLQQFEEAILMDPNARPAAINERFQVKNGYLQTTHERVFTDEPSALLELFLVLQQHADLRGVSAFTVGLIKRHLHLIDEEFRQNPRNHRLFLAILRAQEGVTHELRRMNRYGVLGLYIPSFGRIVGRMQYDLFHAYTVDEHTLFVVSNLRRFALQRFDTEFPSCSRIMQSLEKPEIAYLAGLFHDIAKGRGGDHSTLGALDAEAFCLEHGMSAYDARTVAWLVRQHLVLSMTAQKKDIGDPDVINEFAKLVGDQRHLDYLYILTVADVRGTNPKLWNSWKATLFHDLYAQTSRALRHGLENPIDREQLIEETQAAARTTLAELNISDESISEVWPLMTEDYFLRYRADEIAWHTEVLAESDTESQYGFVDLRQQAGSDRIEAILYTPREKHTFALTTAVLAELAMTIVDARIVPLANDFSLDTYIFLQTESQFELDNARLNKIRRGLTRVLAAVDETKFRVTRRAPRRVRMFSTPTRVDFATDLARGRTVIEIVSADRPGLLSTVGQVFIELNVDIETAKILTVGERAEDIFYVTDENGSALSEDLCVSLKKRMLEELDVKNRTDD